MAPSVLKTFTCFPRLPAELQKQVWEQAAADLPVLDIQRFEADIIHTQQGDGHQGRRELVLCFSPHADFIALTAGHRGLMGACKESRRAALPQMPGMLPVYYVTTDAAGNVFARKGSVPFNTAGYFCISGYCSTIWAATLQVGARGERIPYDPRTFDRIFHIGVDTASQIKKLMITLDPARNARRKETCMRGWDPQWFQKIIRGMPNLEKVSLVGEGIMDRRHQIGPYDFNKLLQTCNLRLRHHLNPLTFVRWNRLWKRLRLHQEIYYAKTQGAIDGLEKCLLRYRSDQNPRYWDSDDVAQFEAEKRELELTLRVIME